MTVVVGILCEDGVVVGSDSSATLAAVARFPTIEQPAKKIFIVGNDVIFAGTGQVGLGQRFEAILSQFRAKPEFHQLDRLAIAKGICAATIKDYASTHGPGNQFGALVAFACQAGFHLCEFAIEGFQPEFKTPDMWFVSMGSGQPITDPLLGLIRRVFFGDSLPRLNEGVFAVTWALQHAIELNTGGINGPPQIAVLSRDAPDQPFAARLLTDEELSEHINNVRGAEEHLASYRQVLSRESEQEIPRLQS